MARTYLSIGSNIDRERYVCGGLDALAAAYGPLCISSVYESEAVGFDGDLFYNLVVGLDTSQSLLQLFEALRQIEHDHQRSRDATKFSARTLDIDILSYDMYVGDFRLDDGSGGTLPRDEITKNAFVLQPLAEIAPECQHPSLRLSYLRLWEQFDNPEQRLWPVSFIWRGQQLSLHPLP
ncbi:MAG: 2-amino-4-hydroxy-6-hydroxymethyldihydropteridine diphosphokinase [Motiliproteus sp.]|jgi:2-amino-4-hydroxy-6-hydroxymethyldihydropteridine diphosphokinase